MAQCGHYGVIETLSGYGEVSNIFDEVFSSSMLILDRIDNSGLAAFLPGDGRAFVAGVKAKF